ncbi:MAG: DUF4982 domain-containing protein [Clostridia bacterium]|nr:DUF4982 domain-containing protein [Clostridia bacterium]
MRSELFHDGWTCKHLEDAGEGRPVSIPDDAMLREKRTAEAESGLNGSWFEGHDYLYTRSFTLSPEDLQDHLVLEFEGVYRNAEVRINGQKAGFRPYGYTNFYVDCDAFVHAGENTLEVIARNADQPNSRWYSGAGIYRPVRLWRGPKQHVELNGVKITTLSVDPVKVRVDVKTTGDGPVRLEILDGETVLACAEGEARSFEMEIPGARPWSPEAPNLYTCRVCYGEDTAEECFGARTLTWGEDGLKINGERVILRGACIHHDNGLLGAACLPDAVERRVRLLMENGYNAIRSAHNPCSKTALAICDRLGMLVMDEYVDMWYIHKTQFDYANDFGQWWQRDLADMVDKDYSHPCVILYSTGNEVAETAQKKGIALTREMTDYLHGLDPTRPVTVGVNIFFNFLNSIGFGQYSDEKAAKEAERNAKAKAEGKKTKERATGSKFFNDLAGIVGADFMKIGATLHGSDVTTRKAFAAMDIAGYNYGEKRYERDLRKYPQRLILGSETFCADAYRFWEIAKKEPRIIGDFVWSGIDYLGEVMVGSWEYQDYAPSFDQGPGWITAGSGRIDLTGKPLGEAFYTRVALEREMGPYIAVRPICHEGKHSPSAWKMTNAMRSWSFRGFEGRKAEVEVYARCAWIQLKLNGHTVGEQAANPKNCLFRFKVPYENGTLEAVAYDESGKVCGRDCLTTAAENIGLCLEPEIPAVEKGHLAFVRLRLADENGVTDVTKRGKITLSVEGGKLLACGSACPFYALDYLGNVCDTYYGEALAIVEVQGDTVLRAESPFGSAEVGIAAV